MKGLGLFAVCLLVFRVPSLVESPHVRALDSLSAASYEAGFRQSATFRRLVDELQRSDLIVHVVTSRYLPGLVVGATRFLGERGVARYARVELSPALTPKARVSVLAHELQHACEIAGSGARSAPGVEAFYRLRGRRAPTLADAWETKEAAAVERRVWVELGTRVGFTSAVE